MSARTQFLTYGPSGIDRELEEDADALLREFALSESRSLRKFGILDERRLRTVHERERTFTAVFYGRAQRRDDNE